MLFAIQCIFFMQTNVFFLSRYHYLNHCMLIYPSPVSSLCVMYVCVCVCYLILLTQNPVILFNAFNAATIAKCCLHFRLPNIKLRHNLSWDKIILLQHQHRISIKMVSGCKFQRLKAIHTHRIIAFIQIKSKKKRKSRHKWTIWISSSLLTILVASDRRAGDGFSHFITKYCPNVCRNIVSIYKWNFLCINNAIN